MPEHLTSLMSGYRVPTKSALGQIVAAEKFEKRIEYLASEKAKNERASWQKRIKEKAIEAVGHNLKRRNYKRIEFVRKYVDMYSRYPFVRRYLHRVSDQLRTAECTPCVGHWLGVLNRMLKEESTDKNKELTTKRRDPKKRSSKLSGKKFATK